MNKLLIAVATLSLLGATAVDAGSRHKHHQRHAYGHMNVQPVRAYLAPPSAVVASSPGPVWAAPWQCFTDEGYGRYWPCGAGPSSR